MIKLIASDLYGTLLLNKAQSVDESVFDMIKSLHKKGIIFAPASGRQFVSLKRLFCPVADDLLYIAENGAFVRYKDEVIHKRPMNRELAMDIIEDVINQPNCEVLVSGEYTAYIKPKTELYHHRMTKVVNYNTTIVDDFSKIEEDILKVAVCDLSGIDNSKEHFINKWSESAAVTVSGELYMDFMDQCVNKGDALMRIQDYLGIKPEECMVFGDNYNDCEMFKAAYHSYAMTGAVKEVKKHAKYITDSVEKTVRKELIDG